MLLTTILLSALSACVVAADRFCGLEDYNGNSRGICGPKIPQMLSVVCSEFGGYHSVNKKSYYDSAKVDSRDNHWPKDDDMFLTEKEATDYLHNPKGKRGSGNQNIVCECCVHQCSYGEMRGYCLKPKDVRRIKRSFPNAPIFKSHSPSPVFRDFLSAERNKRHVKLRGSVALGND